LIVRNCHFSGNKSAGYYSIGASVQIEGCDSRLNGTGFRIHGFARFIATLAAKNGFGINFYDGNMELYNSTIAGNEVGIGNAPSSTVVN
jgi:hypothetical protein